MKKGNRGNNGRWNKLEGKMREGVKERRRREEGKNDGRREEWGKEGRREGGASSVRQRIIVRAATKKSCGAETIL